MGNIKYADAGMDMKKLGLCFLEKSWMMLAAALAGAVLGGVVYALAHIVPEAEREYEAVAKIYLDFAADETGEVYQQYNGYTWNDLLATDPILHVTMEYLPEDYTQEEVVCAARAEILSDLRLLTVTVTTHHPDRSDAILRAIEQSLVRRGKEAKEFKRIEAIRTTEAALVVADDRTGQAVLVGLALAVIAALFGMMFYYVLDDRILVASDLKQVTDASFVGYANAGGRFGADYDSNLAYLRESKGKIEVLAVAQDKADEADLARDGAVVQGVSGGKGAVQDGAAVQGVSGRKDTAQDGATAQSSSGGKDMVQEETATPESWRKLCEADGVVLVADYGKVHAAYLAYVIEQLNIRECPLVGVAIDNADGKFLGRYYGRAFGRR